MVGQYVLGIRQRSERRGVVPGSGEVRVDDDGSEVVVLAVVLLDELHGDRSVEGFVKLEITAGSAGNSATPCSAHQAVHSPQSER